MVCGRKLEYGSPWLSPKEARADKGGAHRTQTKNEGFCKISFNRLRDDDVNVVVSSASDDPSKTSSFGAAPDEAEVLANASIELVCEVVFQISKRHK